jgi:tRNA-dihydrouridine synthase
MRAATGCSYVMVGHAAMFNPWIFSGRAVSRREAATFLLEYAHAMRANGANPRASAGRTKQLLRGWSVGGIIRDGTDRLTWMREQDPQEFIRRLSRLVESCHA